MAAKAQKKKEVIIEYKRERQKINSAVMALQREHYLYDHLASIRPAAMSDQINRLDKKIEDLRLIS